jgi:hypothetical protein
MNDRFAIDRRALLRAAALGGAGLGVTNLFPAWAQNSSHGTHRPPGRHVNVGKAMPTLTGNEVRLIVDHGLFDVDGRKGHAITVNGTIPAP